MTFNVSDFRSQITGEGSRGISKQSNFQVVVNTPPKILLSDRSKNAQDNIRFRVESAEFPGRTIQTSNYKSHGYGLNSKVGYDVTYQDVTLTFLCGADLGEKSFFHAWQSMVIGNHSRNDDITRHQSLGYYNDYVSSLGIVQYDTQNKPTYAMALAEAYPISVNSMPLSWSSEELHRLTVQFAYKYFKETDEPAAGRGAKANEYGAKLTINGIPSVDDIFEGFGLPRIGEIFNIPILNTNSFTFKGSSDFDSLF